MQPTKHRIIAASSQIMTGVSSESVHLVVTSPPYPMIQMWDDMFTKQNPEIGEALEKGDGDLAFTLMHYELDKVWDEVYRVLAPGGIACINIGDATRTIDGRFNMYSNHAYVINRFVSLGFTNLPSIIWHKQTNAPNKFMGSGMLSPGAYVTLEHEHILIFRKGGKREFTTADQHKNRRASAYFYEERNKWFSDDWDIQGQRQKTGADPSKRSAAFPFEIPYRLVNMFSVKGDTVLDPFVGTGTTMLAAIAAERNSIGIDIAEMPDSFRNQHYILQEIAKMNSRIAERLRKHDLFIDYRRKAQNKSDKYYNENIEMPVVTRQERDIVINFVSANVDHEEENILVTSYLSPAKT